MFLSASSLQVNPDHCCATVFTPELFFQLISLVYWSFALCWIWQVLKTCKYRAGKLRRRKFLWFIREKMNGKWGNFYGEGFLWVLEFSTHLFNTLSAVVGSTFTSKSSSIARSRSPPVWVCSCTVNQATNLVSLRLRHCSSSHTEQMYDLQIYVLGNPVFVDTAK